MHVGIDLVGNIAILKFDKEAKKTAKKKYALAFLKKYKQLTTVLEKVEKFKGRLRTPTTAWLAGDKTKEALYKENNCVFRFNTDTCYFSPRLSTERSTIAEMVKKTEHVLVMFGGVAPFAIVIAKQMKQKLGKNPRKKGRVVSIELGRECSKYAQTNVKRNKLEDFVEIVQGDVKKKLPLRKEKFDRIVMARPQLKESFLDIAFPAIKKGGIIHYYGFYNEQDKEQLKELLLEKAKQARKKIRILRIVKAGDVGPYKYRYRADIHVKN